MIFDKNQKEFPSEAHRAIWDTGIHVLPIEITLPEEVRGKLPPYMVNSCEQMQKFFLHLLSDLYENPEIYEPYLYRRIGIQYKFIIPFSDFGLVGEANEDCLTINRTVFDKLFLKQIKSKGYCKSSKITMSARRRIEILERTGLKISYESSSAILTNALYPNMFYAIREMALITLKEKGSGDNSFTYCDFRQLCKDYKYDKFENALVFLNDEDKNIAIQLDIIAKKYKLTRSIKSGHCPGYAASYTYKKNMLMDFNCMGNSLSLSIRFLYNKNNTAPIYKLFDVIENDSDDLKNFVYNRLNRCWRCYTGCAGYVNVGFPMQIYGKTNKMCIYTDRIGIYMPNKANVKNFVKLSDLHMIEKTLMYVKNMVDEML